MLRRISASFLSSPDAIPLNTYSTLGSLLSPAERRLGGFYFLVVMDVLLRTRISELKCTDVRILLGADLGLELKLWV